MDTNNPALLIIYLIGWLFCFIVMLIYLIGNAEADVTDTLVAGIVSIFWFIILPAFIIAEIYNKINDFFVKG